MLVSALVNDGVAFQAKILGVHGEFGQSAYTADELYKKHGMDSAAISTPCSRAPAPCALPRCASASPATSELR
jgi:transketolase C-terminal domain/subunit